MRKTKLIIATLAISMLLSSTALAGTWTHTHETEWGINTYDDLWFYVKDSGEYAETNGFRMKTVHGIGLMMVVHCPHGLVWQPMAAFTIQPENI